MISNRLASTELYDKRFDWLVAALLALPLVWLFYGFDAAFVCLLLFTLVGALKPLIDRLGSRLAAGISAAGLILLLSPLLRFVFYNGYCFDGPWSVAAGIRSYAMPNFCERGLFSDFAQDLWVGPLRDVAMPIFGLGLILLVGIKPSEGQAANEEYPTDTVAKSPRYGRDLLRRSFVVLALLAWVGGTCLNYRAEQAALEEQRMAKTSELLRQADEAKAEAKRIAAEKVARRVDRAFLLGSWASVENGSSDPQTYCGTDAGFIFNNNGSFSAASAQGSFFINENKLLLSDRTSLEFGELDAPALHLGPETLKVERKGKRLIIDGVTYGRC